MESSTGSLIQRRARDAPGAPAICARGRRSLSYKDLEAAVDRTRLHLNSHGVGRGDRIALIVTSRPIALTAYLCVVSSAVAVPVNPDLTPHELGMVLDDLGVKAAILSGDRPELRRVLEGRSIPVFLAEPDNDGPAGSFALAGGVPGAAQHPGPAVAADVACVQTSSGSTGRPKASRLTHATLLFRAERDCQALRLTPDDVTINFRPPYLSGPLNIGLMASIFAGGAIVVPPDFDADGFFEDIIRFGVTWYTGGPVYHRAILESAPRHGEAVAKCRLRFVRSAGYALAIELQEQLEATFGVPCIQKYGSSEAGLISSNPLPPGKRIPGSCGPLIDCEVRLLDADGKAVEGVGARGEIVVRGPGVFSGYDDAALNENAFIGEWFRTGDEGFFDEHGYLNVSGRLNEVINRGGQKISPEEVEKVFAAHPDVASALCFPCPHATLGAVAAIAIAPAPGATIDEPELRAYAGEKLARFKVPEFIVVTDRIPRGPTGKPLRNAAAAFYGLDRPEKNTAAASTPAAPERLPQDRLEEIWCEALKLERVSDAQNFTMMGGDSLRAVRLQLMIEAAYGVRLDSDVVYGAGATLPGLRACLTEARPNAHGHDGRADVPPRPDPAADLPLTSSQRRIWSICKTHPKLAIYNSAFGLRLPGVSDLAAIRRAVECVIERHEALRAVFPESGGVPRQAFRPPGAADIAVTDLRAAVSEGHEARMFAKAREAAARPYDLAHGPLARAQVFLGDDETMLVFQTHHIIGDAITSGILARELSAAYAAFAVGGAPELPSIEADFGDYVAWQAERLDAAEMERLLDFWVKEIGAADTELLLPKDRPRPDVLTHRGERLPIVASGEVTAGLRKIAARNGASLFATTLAIFEIFLHRLTGQTDFLVAISADIRPPALRNQLVGFFVNTLAHRARLDASTRLDDHIRAANERLGRVLKHAEVPFDALVRRMRSQRRDSTPPLVQAMFGFMPTDARTRRFGQAKAELFNFDHDRTRFDLSFMFEETEGALVGFVEYSTDIFERVGIERMIGRFETLLEDIVADPERSAGAFNILPSDERRTIARFSVGPKVPYPSAASIAGVFAETARAFADRTAVICGGREVSYAALDDWSDRLAQRLRADGVGRETVVAITAERTPALIAGLLGILKAGGAYLAIEPSLPDARRAHILADSGARLLLVQKASDIRGAELACPVLTLGEGDAYDAPSDVPDRVVVGGGDLAYVCYTSGSTGAPKGVAVEHRGVLRLVKGQAYVDLAPGERMLQFSSASFDASTFEIWGALLNGGTLVQPEARLPSISELAELIIERRITTVWLTAGLFRQMVDLRPDCFRNVRQALAGGDVLSVDHVRALLDQAPSCRIINGYGPTENTTFSTCCVVERTDLSCGSTPIGRPIANSSAYILDDRQALAPIGIEGELYVGGDGVARGYLNLPEQTNGAFLPDPFAETAGARMYRTGDRARMLQDGAIVFLGRTDSQIKIRGFRVELQEIEEVLRRRPEIRDAVVAARRDGATVRSLAAFVIPETVGTPPDVPALRASLNKDLPDYMMPATISVIDAFPLKASDKVDIQRLLELETTTFESRPHVAPRTPVEALIASIWSELLGRENIGIDDDFFDMGGHSLLIMQLAFRLEEETGETMEPIDFFRFSTIRALALEVTERLVLASDPAFDAAVEAH